MCFIPKVIWSTQLFKSISFPQISLFHPNLDPMEYSIDHIYKNTFNGIITYDRAYLSMSVFAGELLSMDRFTDEQRALFETEFTRLFDGFNGRVGEGGNISFTIQEFRNICAHKSWRMNFTHASNPVVCPAAICYQLHDNVFDFVRFGTLFKVLIKWM